MKLNTGEYNSSISQMLYKILNLRWQTNKCDAYLMITDFLFQIEYKIH